MCAKIRTLPRIRTLLTIFIGYYLEVFPNKESLLRIAVAIRNKLDEKWVSDGI